MNSKSCIRITAWLGALFLMILGAKFWVIRMYGTGILYWDQWDEAGLLFKPWLEGHLTWGALVAPHNEHRIFFTRVLDLFIVWLNGQWDPRLQMVVNAFIHAGFACFLAYGLWGFTGKKHAALTGFLMAPFFILPFAAENTIHGFQSQMYFLSIFSLATILGLGFGTAGSTRWFLGLAAAVMALFTMGSGLLASLAVVGLMILRILRQKRFSRDVLFTMTCGLAVFIAGLALNVTVERDQGFHAHSLLVFLDAWMSGLAWPFWNAAPMLFVLCLPLIFTCIKYFQPDFKNPRAAEFVLTLGFWGILQITGLTYARAGLGNSSRYMDTFCIIPIACAASWLVLAENMDFGRGLRRALPILWVGILLAGLVQLSQKTLSDYLSWSLKWELLEEDNVRAFVNTDNPAYLSGASPLAIPYWSSDRLIELLRDPKLSAILPPACRPALKLEKDATSDGTVTLGGCPADKPGQGFTRIWGSFDTNGPEATGSFISRPVSATLPDLIIPICVGPGQEGIRVQLVEESTGRTIELPIGTTERWQTVNVPAPKNPFRLKISDQSHRSWVAVGDIQETGHLSRVAEILLNHATAIFTLGLGMVFLLICWAMMDKDADRGRPWTLIVLAGLLVLTDVWLTRNSDATQLAVSVHQVWATHYAASGNVADAERQWREVLWLQPDNATAREHLRLPPPASSQQAIPR